MHKQDIRRLINEFTDHDPRNIIAQDTAISQELAGLRIFALPLVAFAPADDETFGKLKDPAAVGPEHLSPSEWLPGSKSVLSIFFPFSDDIRRSNRADRELPSPQWLHGRIEGQAFISALSEYLTTYLKGAGYPSVSPAIDERFCQANYKSNWSERHVAYLSGLGTFCLSKGLITSRGVAGRFGSVITALEFEPDAPQNLDLYGNCTFCGACIRNCPAQAISIAEGKDHTLCEEFLDKMELQFFPRYGCGKCQVNVPCEFEIPKKKQHASGR